MGEPMWVNVVATDPVLEAGVTSALLGCPDIAVVTTRERAVVTVLVVDHLGREALDAVRSVRAGADRPEVVLVVPEVEPAEALWAIAAGARGLLRRREATADRLTRTVLAAGEGDCTVSPDMLDRLLAAPTVPAGTLASNISDRERAVLRLLADGRETGEIAQELCYSTRTVTSVVHDITRRFRLRNRAHAVAFALRAGML
ncbi:DNA-binding response regulator, NarL/FixJ family, contains REC and HTH domains [Micromonospora matsumotoense]|uniref:DNA-binding response regulator, NarL/FixJ family, contains REC and HTH domains n=1 Tax=Micromonospora matsumotoense TaxID=121616 RepID=A0A1C4Z881_9ACTN|nr:LuxR C-terminal-related transcriptional regulator [Micromonospora matsumotoense]SCF29067.1 DNA-binding response regulator, NarL/FixJ family, contains REC and HTH domains [Micromonospora matsumotoense]